MKIAYYVHDLDFPLREGVRKQAWWSARAMHKRGHEVIIVSTSNKKRKIIREGIRIIYGNPWQIRKINCDILHYISHPTPLILPLLFFAKAKRQIMSMFDGELNSFWKRPWDFLLSWLVNKKVQVITIQTNYQQKLMNKTKLKVPFKIVLPLFPILKKSKSKSRQPTILFMSNFHPNKGIFEVLNAFCLARRKIKNLNLIIANSGLVKDKKVLHRIRLINQNDIILKKVVNPQDELSAAWIYLYPLRCAQETFSIPLSLVESAQIKTTFITTNVGAMDEFFLKDNLVAPRSSTQLAQKIIELINKPLQLKSKLNFDNQQVIDKFEKTYKM